MPIKKAKSAAYLLLSTSLILTAPPLSAAEDVTALQARVAKMERELAEMKALLKQRKRSFQDAIDPFYLT